ncbi:hypothetical protein F5H01DRAFT_354253 [Linnemannia elongata]|nr:hypothetical protein F5H01DRAFT_354253 [Linnemannia elongata]
MGQNQSTPSTQEPYHKRHYTATNRQIQRQNSISLTSPTHLLQNPGPNPLRDYALKRQGTLSMQSSSTVNLYSSSTITNATTTTTTGVTGDNNSGAGGGDGGATRPFIRLMPIEIPQPVYFDESSASEEDDYDYDDGGDGEYSSDGYSDSYDHPHSLSRHNSNHRRRTHRSSNNHEYSDEDDTDLVEQQHHHHRNNKRGLASSPTYLDSAALNGRTTTSGGTDAYGYEQSMMSREQADYRRSKEEEDEDLSYLSPVSGTRRFAKPTYPRGGLHSEPFYPPHPHLSHDDDLANNQNLTDDTSDDDAYNEELLIKRYQLRDLPSVQTGGVNSGEATDTIVAQLDVSSSLSARSPTSPTLILDAIREEKEDDEILSSLPSKTVTTGERGEGPVSVSSSNNSLKESSRMGYSLHHAQPLQEANNQHTSSSTFSNFNIKGGEKGGERDGSYSFEAAHNTNTKSSSPLPPLDSSSSFSSSSYQYHEQGQGQQEQEQRRVRGERYDGDEVRTDLDLSLHQEKAVHLQHKQSSSQQDPTATGPRDTATPSRPAPALAPRPPKSSNDLLVVLDSEEQEEHEEQQGGGRRRTTSTHSRQGSTTLRKEMLSNVSQRVGDLDSRVNQMDALVSYKLTDIESKVQVLHDAQDTVATPDQQPTPQETSTSNSSDPNPPMSFAEGEQPLTNPLPTTTNNPLRTSQLLSKASLLELRLELQAFGMRFHELNDALLTDLMTQMRQAKLMLFESTNIAASPPIDPITGAVVVRRVDRAEAEMHAKLLGEIETRIQERVLAMEVTSARLEKCFDQMEARLGALEIVLVGGAGTGTGTGTTGTTTVLKRPRPESMYKILQQQQAQLQREQQQEQRQQGLGFTHRSQGSSDSSSPESPTPYKFPSTTHSISRTTTTSSSSSLTQKPPAGVGLNQQNARAVPRPTRILTTPVPHLLQQRTAPLSANSTTTTASAIPTTRNHRAHTLENHPTGPINLVPNGHINGPISAHPLSSSLPLARHHLLTTQRSMTALMAGPINNAGPRSATHVDSSLGTNGVDNTGAAGGEGARRGKASGQKVIRRPSSYKELLHFWKAGGSTPDLLNTANP